MVAIKNIMVSLLELKTDEIYDNYLVAIQKMFNNYHIIV